MIITLGVHVEKVLWQLTYILVVSVTVEEQLSGGPCSQDAEWNTTASSVLLGDGNLTTCTNPIAYGPKTRWTVRQILWSNRHKYGSIFHVQVTGYGISCLPSGGLMVTLVPTCGTTNIKGCTVMFLCQFQREVTNLQGQIQCTFDCQCTSGSCDYVTILLGYRLIYNQWFMCEIALTSTWPINWMNNSNTDGTGIFLQNVII